MRHAGLVLRTSLSQITPGPTGRRSRTERAELASCLRGGALPADNATTARVLKIRGPANLAGAWSAQPVPASRRPPRAAHRPAAARAPRTTPGCTCGHGSAPPTAPRPRAYAGGGPWRRKSPFGSPMTGRRPRMTRAHDAGGARWAGRMVPPARHVAFAVWRFCGVSNFRFSVPFIGVADHRRAQGR